MPRSRMVGEAEDCTIDERSSAHKRVAKASGRRTGRPASWLYAQSNAEARQTGDQPGSRQSMSGCTP